MTTDDRKPSVTTEEILQDLAGKLGKGEIKSEDYMAKVEELISEARNEALHESQESEAEPASSVAEDRIKSAVRKARSYS